MSRVGVIAHLDNPSVHDVVDLAVTAEAAGADWLGLADAFWWRDVWMLLASAARATTRIELGPAMTNPYLRHPFHTVAALATLQDIAGPRVFLGLAAGGSELRGAAGVDRRDAPARVAALAALVRSVAGGGALDEASGRRLDVALSPVPVLVAGKGLAMLRTAGAVADRALLWAFPASDVDRAAAVVRAAGPPTDLVWAPLVDHGPDVTAGVEAIAVYGVLNASPALRRTWGVTPDDVDRIRRALVAGDRSTASALVPRAVRDDLVMAPMAPAEAAAVGRRIGATSMALPSFATATLPARLAWARAVADAL